MEESNIKPEENPGIYAKISSLLSGTLSKLQTAGSFVNNKFQEYEIPSRLRNATYNAFILIKDTTGYMVVKSQPVVEQLKEKTIQGLEYTKDGMYRLYEEYRNPKIEEKKEPMREEENVRESYDSKIGENEYVYKGEPAEKEEIQINEENINNHLNQEESFVDINKNENIRENERNSFNILGSSDAQEEQCKILIKF
jgi:hypothetical protein